jgi:hypothetical protein
LRNPSYASVLSKCDGSWFPAEAIERLGEVQRSLRSPQELARVASELRDERLLPLGEQPDDRQTVLNYYRLLLERLWPVDLRHALARPREEVTQQDQDLYLRFLEADPYFFRSGYFKERALKRLGAIPLSDRLAARAERLLERELNKTNHQLPRWKKLARLVPARRVLALIESARASEDPNIRNNAIDLGLYAADLPAFMSVAPESLGAAFS